MSVSSRERGVDAHVTIEVARLTEAQAAQLALVRLLAGVDANVLRERRTVREGLLAHATAIWSFARMCAHVSGD